MKKIFLFLFLLPLVASAQLTLPYSIKINNAKPVDYYYYESDGTPYDNTAEVLSAIPSAVRYQGMTVNVVGVEYWFKDGITDEDLVVKLAIAMDSTNFWRTKSDFTIPSSRTITVAEGEELIFQSPSINYLSFKGDGITLGSSIFGVYLDYQNVAVNFVGNSTGGVFIRAGTSAQASVNLFSQIASITAASTIKFGPNAGAIFSMNTASTEGIITISHKANSNSNVIINPSGSTESEIQVVNTSSGETTSIKPEGITMGNVDPTEIGYLDGVTSAIQPQLASKTTTALTARTGTSIAFDANARYGTHASPETGNITYNSTGAVVGQVVTLIHNDSSEPTWGSEFDIISGSYVTGSDNKIMMLLVEAGKIWVTISQTVE